MAAVIALLVLIIGITIPTMVNMGLEQDLRENSTDVQQQARRVRLLAMKSGNTRDLFFTRHSCFLAPIVGDDEEEGSAMTDPELTRRLLRGVDITVQEEEELETAADPALPKIDLPEGFEFRVYSDERKRWLPVQLWRWRFQPNGLCEPLTIRIAEGENFAEMTFSPLTARVEEENLFMP